MKDLSSMQFVFNGTTKFTCLRDESDGAWVCRGEIRGIEYEVTFKNSGLTHVFQHLENLVRTHI